MSATITAAPSEKLGPKGIGGWLAVLILLLFVNGLILGLMALGDPDVPAFLSFVLLPIAAFPVWAGVQLLRKKKQGILIAKILLWAGICMSVLVTFVSPGDTKDPWRNVAELGFRVAIFASGLRYLQQSKRVKNTFFEPEPEKVEAAVEPTPALTIPAAPAIPPKTKLKTSEKEEAGLEGPAGPPLPKTVTGKTLFRRIAREAVIFMLSAMALSAIGDFCLVVHDDAQQYGVYLVNGKAETIKGLPQNSVVGPPLRPDGTFEWHFTPAPAPQAASASTPSPSPTPLIGHDYTQVEVLAASLSAVSARETI